MKLTDNTIIFITPAGPADMYWVQTNSSTFFGIDYAADVSRHVAFKLALDVRIAIGS